MTDERQDYAVLISLAMREEAEVMASALRAEGIDAFIGNRHHATWDWGYVIALGGLQVLVPHRQIAEAKLVIRERISEAAANPEGEAVGRKDRWKAWAVISYSFVIPVLVSLVAMLWAAGETDTPQSSDVPLVESPAYFAAPDYLPEAEQRLVLQDHCPENQAESVISREDGMGYITACVDVLRMDN